MTIYGVDSTHAIPLGQLTSHGISAFGGYSPTNTALKPSWKTLLPYFAHDLHSNDFGVWDVFESTTDRAKRSGEVGGRLDASIYCAFYDSLGVPKSVWACWSIDEDDSIDAVRSYARGWHDEASRHGRASGCYCGAAVGEAMFHEGLISGYWKTGSRSFDRGVAPTHAHIIQKTSAAIPDTDDDIIVVAETPMIWWPAKPVPPKPVWHAQPFPGPLYLGNPDGHVVAQWKFLMVVAGYGHFNHANQHDIEIAGETTIKELDRMDQGHDVIMFKGGVTDMSQYFATYKDGKPTYTHKGGEKKWAYLNWLIANLTHQNQDAPAAA